MSWMKKTRDEAMPNREPNREIDLEIDPVLKQALASFRENVHAWSEAAYSRPRTQVQAASGWRLAVAWAMGCVLIAGGLSGAWYERHHRAVIAAQVAEQQRATEQRQLAAQQRASVSNEDLLATVDSDISRDVPAAMEPLAHLMDDEGTGQQ
jgi:hypothetical protein